MSRKDEGAVFEDGEVPAGRLVILLAAGGVSLLLCLGVLIGLYHFLANGPQAALRPVPTPGPPLETALFRAGAAPHPRSNDPAIAAAQGYRWRDTAHTRLRIPIARAMAMTAARGAAAFDPPPVGDAKTEGQR